MEPVLSLLRRWIPWALAALAASWASAAAAQAVSEPAVKAAYLYKFGGYVEFPPAALLPAEAFTIAVLGDDEVAAELERLAPGRTLQGRSFVVRRVRDAAAARGSQLLFVGRGEPRAGDAVRAAQRLGIVTVTDADKGLETGSVINFVSFEARIAFEVSLDAASRTGVGVSSRMLGVARRVVPKA